MNLCNSLITNATPPPHRILSLLHQAKPPIRQLRISLSSESTHQLNLAESLQSETLKILEWPAVCAQIAAFTSTSMGLDAAQSARIPLGRTPDESERLLAQTSAAFALPQPLEFSGIEDISALVDLAVAGELLSIPELCSVKRTLRSARHLLEQLEEFSADDKLCERFPLLEIFRSCDFLMELEQKLEYCIDCNLSVVLDRASEELERIRSERKRNMENLELMLKLQGIRIFQAGGIDKPLVTKRRSRMCISIRASHRSLLPDGVVLDISSSGATYFMEPKEAIDLNNEEVRLSDYEKVEERTILSMLTSEIAQSMPEIKSLLDRILEVDLSFARAGHARWMRGVCPALTSESDDSASNSLLVDIKGIQHPLLLEPSLKKLPDLVASKSRKSVATIYQKDESPDSEIVSPVPIDFQIGDNIKVVIISGPNTGGKTASMKTLGLSSIMLKAGMYLPAHYCPRLPWFDFVLADIGDQQSLEQSLSTFSGHISRLSKIFEVTSEKSLVLIDEIGSGTDPSEGMALSTSILQYLKDRVKLAVVTTHYADLTRLKEKDSSFENAAVDFSLATLQPTYRMLWGSRGESNALNIAKMIGVDEKIISRAQVWLNKLAPEKMQMRRSLLYESLKEERNRLEIQANRAVSLHSDVMNLYNEIQDEAVDLDVREAALKAKESQWIQQELKDVKAEIDVIVQEFEKQLRTSDVDQLNMLLKKSETAVASIVESHQRSVNLPESEAGSSLYVPQIGEQVRVKGLGNKLAMVVEPPGDGEMILVQYGKIRVRVNISDIRPLANDVSATKAPFPISKRKGERKKNIKNLKSLLKTSSDEEGSFGPVFQTSKNTVDLRGMRAEEATNYLEMAISSRGSNSVLFVIHGMGTGVIKECALKLLKSHPRVTKFEQESAMNYGCTVAYIK